MPAKIDAVTSIDFGTVIVGASAEESLSIENIAVPPADSLDYNMTATTWFAVPSGTFSLEAGGSDLHTVTMNTSVAAVRSGTLVVYSDDLDNPEWNVSLEGTVLDHASPSLVDSAVVLSDTVDFGSHEIGSFSNQTVEVFNFGYSGLQSELEIYGYDLTGDSRFEIVGGFTPQTVAGVPAEYTIAFDDSGATGDSLYTATLTLHTEDDTNYPGWEELDDIVLLLEAFVDEGTPARVPASGIELGLETVTANPFSESVSLLLKLPRSQQVTIQVYDVSGRLVKNLAGKSMSAGSHDITWDGRDERGNALASGLFFIRAQVGDWSKVEKFVLIR